MLHHVFLLLAPPHSPPTPEPSVHFWFIGKECKSAFILLLEIKIKRWLLKESTYAPSCFYIISSPSPTPHPQRCYDEIKTRLTPKFKFAWKELFVDKLHANKICVCVCVFIFSLWPALSMLFPVLLTLVSFVITLSPTYYSNTKQTSILIPKACNCVTHMLQSLISLIEVASAISPMSV